MDKLTIVYIVFSILSALTMFIAIGAPRWACGAVFGDGCKGFSYMQPVGALLLIAGMILVIVTLLLILSIFKEIAMLQIVNAVLTGVAALFSFAAMVTYYSAPLLAPYSPFTGTIGMTLAMQLAITMIASFVISKIKK